jgi:predicted Rossmann fold flavoprotein
VPETRASCDLAIVGAGAAGIMAAITAGRAARRSRAVRSIVLLDGAATLGAKILVAGGGRCNVTHDVVDERAFAGSTPASIRKVLRRFTVDDTIEFFRELHVTLKREETGKLFPTTDRARTVLDALLRAAREAGVEIVHPWRVENVTRTGRGFRIEGKAGAVSAPRVILATGGKALPKSGSDGHGYELARRLGHTTTERILPGLVPLVLAESCFVRKLTGLTLPATIALRSSTGKVLRAFTGSTLCTHFGLSGPPVLDLSRYWLHARLDDPSAHLTVDWLPARELAWIPGRSIGSSLRALIPERMADALAREAGVDPGTQFDRLSREARNALTQAIRAYRLPVTGDRGFTFAEVTAGGVPLAELSLDTLESRLCPGLSLVGEILDVDGMIGGYNFQWAWASGFVAGSSVGSTVPLFS